MRYTDEIESELWDYMRAAPVLPGTLLEHAETSPVLARVFDRDLWITYLANARALDRLQTGARYLHGGADTERFRLETRGLLAANAYVAAGRELEARLYRLTEGGLIRRYRNTRTSEREREMCGSLLVRIFDNRFGHHALKALVDEFDPEDEDADDLFMAAIIDVLRARPGRRFKPVGRETAVIRPE